MVLGRLRIVAAAKQRAGLSLYLIWSNSLSTCDMSHDLYVVAMIVIHWLELKIRFRSKYRKSGLTVFFSVQFFCGCRLYKLSALRGVEWVGHVSTL